MRLTIRQILIVSFLTVVAAVLVGVGFAVAAGHRDEILERTRAELAREVALLADDLQGRELVAPDSLVRAWSSMLDHRITLIRPDGAVLADSDVLPGRMGAVENHGDRPEFRAASPDSIAFSRRTSETVGRPLLYAARLVETAPRPVVLRLAASLEGVEGSTARLARSVLAVGAAAMLLSLLLAFRLARAQAEPLAALTRRARSWTDGEFGAEPGPGRSATAGLAGTAAAPLASRITEIDELGTAFTRLGAELQARFSELESQRDQTQILVDSMAEGVLALTEDARILRTNEAARELLELPSSLRFAPVGSVIRHPELRELLETAVIRSFQSREVILGDRSLIVQSRPLGGGGAVVTLLDVTQLRRLEQVRRDFVANASHELKTPLTSVRGFSETLLDDDPPEEIRHRFLRAILDNTIRLQKLVDDLLDLSRLESGGWVAKAENIAVAAVVRDAWQDMERRAGEKGIEISIEGEAVVRADPRGLSEVFRNLLENSVQYTPSGGSVRVAIRRSGGEVTVEVADTGMGIASAALPRIFERFYRADPARSREEGGTGLGLAIVKHLVEAMGGGVDAESRLGRGTTVRVVLPAGEPIRDEPGAAV